MGNPPDNRSPDNGQPDKHAPNTQVTDDHIRRFLMGWWNLNRTMTQGIEPLLAQRDLDLRRHMLMMAIRKGAVYPKELSEKLQIPSTLLSRYIDSLVQAGLLVRQIDPQDSRRTRLTLTPQGEGVLEQSVTDIRAHTNEKLQSVTPEELEVLLQALERLSAYQSQN